MAHDDDDDEAELSRRALLKRTAALAALAVAGVDCSSGDDDSSGSAAGNPSNAGGQPGAGAPSPPGAGNSAAGSSASGGKGGAGSSAQSGGGGVSAQSGTGGSNTSGSGSGGNTTTPGSDAGDMTASDAGGMPDNGKIKVAAVKRMDPDEAVMLAVQLAGGIDEIEEGQTVFIKPNAVSDRAIGTPGIRTSNEVLSAVIKLVKARKPGHIIVGDRSARGFDTVSVFQNAGIADAAMAAGADEVYMAPSPTDQPDAWVLMMPPGYDMTWSGAGGILAMRKIVEADHLISVPTCKNHRYALHSLSMKNFIGAIGDSSRDPLHYGDSLAGNFETLCRDIAVLNQMFSPLMSIIDATSAVINGGPQGDGADTVRTSPGLVLASRNRVALDALALSLIKLELSRNDVPQPDASHELLMTTKPFMFPQLVNGAMRGIGPSDASGVELLFDAVPDADMLETIYRS